MRTELISQPNKPQRSSKITRLSKYKKFIIASALALTGLLIWQFVRPVNIFSIDNHFALPDDASHPLVDSSRIKAKKPVTGTADFYKEWQATINSYARTEAHFHIGQRFDNTQADCWLCYTPLDRQQPEKGLSNPMLKPSTAHHFPWILAQNGTLVPDAILPGFTDESSLKQCVRLKRIDLDDSDILNKKHQRELFHKYMGQCINAKLLKAVMADVSDFYIKRGNITTRPYLKKQTIANGQIDISVLKGSVEDIVDAATKKTNTKIRTAFAFQKGHILDLRDLETSLEMMNRPPSSDARFEIMPGTRPGTSIIEVKSHDALPYHLKVGLSGRKSIGDNNLFLTMELSMDNLLNINDILTFRYNGSRVQREFQSNRAKVLSYSFPVASYLFELIGSRFSYRQGVQGINNIFLANGNTNGQRLRVSKILMRNQKNKFSAALSVYHKNTKNFLANQLIEVSSYKTTLVQLDLMDTWLQRWGRLTMTYSYYQGTDWFGAREDSFFSAQTGMKNQAKLQFKKQTLDINLLYYLKDRSYQITSDFYLQRTGDLLFDNDKLMIGSDYTVRGYLDRNLYGNNAWYIESNLTKTWRPNLQLSRVQTISLFGGLDYGYARCEVDNPVSCGKIYGAAIGFTAHARHWMANFVWSRPFKKITANFKLSTLFRFDLTWEF